MMRRLPLAIDRSTHAVRAVRAVLVGPIQQENLALQYMAAAARRPGTRSSGRLCRARRPRRALRETLLEEPDLVGLGIAFQNDIADYIAFMRALRARGYPRAPHLRRPCAHLLLRGTAARRAGLDTAVRHEGEDTLVEMLDAIAPARRRARSPAWSGARATGSRGAPRTALPDLDTLPGRAGARAPTSVGGIPVEFLITARGCIGECSYCSIAAYTSE